MIRTIINIDKEKCNGCGLCVNTCHEGAIGMVDGKAELLRDDYCDGLGNCLPVCPTGAISFEEREALAYDEEAVNENMKNKANSACGCPGTQVKEINHKSAPEALACGCPGTHSKTLKHENIKPVKDMPVKLNSELNQWPVQIKLVPPNAPYFKNANLLIAADCTAYAYGNFHEDFIKNRITLIGCPKLDEGDYAEKLTAILKMNDINSVTVVRMEVPCCGGIENAVKTALMNCGKLIQWQVVVISTDGNILNK